VRISWPHKGTKDHKKDKCRSRGPMYSSARIMTRLRMDAGCQSTFAKPMEDKEGNGPPAHNCAVVTVTGWLTAKAAEDCAHSGTLSRGRKSAGEGFITGFRTTAGCQPAIQPIANPMPLGFHRCKTANHIRIQWVALLKTLPWPMVGLVGMPGHFYQHHLSPARDSLAPARSALRAFAAAANS